MAERTHLTREEYNEVFEMNLTEEEFEKIMSQSALDCGYEKLTQLTIVDKTTMKKYRFTKVNTLMLNIDGKDRIHVEVKKGITIDGIVTVAQKFGNQFQINGYLTEGES